ncbi:CobW family GTP-binding protein [Martelella endophytica]|uniref:ATP-binding protein n=1 Tax=Martelella endophytica TaxID=1486262 RepID=A0A0D5LR31_MAREN|nr:GTP-binding protein [Martelella endophytica]AJY46227.1 ATP-binding protein [Martelella endophytica]
MYQLPHPIPVSIVTGFLGAGKSTLINRLLRDPALSDAAVIINEFGEIGIDHLLVESAGDGIIELSNGCLCCSVRGELIDTLANLLDAVQTERVRPVGRVIIETTGLADPVPVLQAVMAHPAIAASFRIDGVVTLVDALAGLATLDGHIEAVRQAAVADRIVLTKTDIASAEQTNALQDRLTALNPMAKIVDVADGEAVRPGLLAAGLFDLARKPDAVGDWLSAEPAHHHHHHDVNRHDEHIRAFALAADRPLAPGAIEAFQHRLAANHGDRLLRLKGVVAVEGMARPLVVHGVRDMVYPPSRLEAWPPGSEGLTRIVVITRDLPEAPVSELFAAFTGRPGIDRPDRAALEENPLSAFGFRR